MMTQINNSLGGYDREVPPLLFLLLLFAPLAPALLCGCAVTLARTHSHLDKKCTWIRFSDDCIRTGESSLSNANASDCCSAPGLKCMTTRRTSLFGEEQEELEPLEKVRGNGRAWRGGVGRPSSDGVRPVRIFKSKKFENQLEGRLLVLKSMDSIYPFSDKFSACCDLSIFV
jgi:hypothetical protein